MLRMMAVILSLSSPSELRADSKLSLITVRSSWSAFDLFHAYLMDQLGVSDAMIEFYCSLASSDPSGGANQRKIHGG